MAARRFLRSPSARHTRGVEVALGRSRRTDAHGLVGKVHVRCVGIGIGEDGDRADAEAAERADHPHGDLAAVGDEHPIERASRPCLIDGVDRAHSRLPALEVRELS